MRAYGERGQQPGHVPVPPELRVPSEHQHVFRVLALVDADLRIRRSIDRPMVYVLERRCRTRPAVNTSMALRSDMHVQARDGYLHIAWVAPIWLTRPWNIVQSLRNDGVDLWEAGGADRVENELQYEERWQKETRRRRRRETFRHIALEYFAHIQRHDGARVSNPGLAPA
jgi:hypothetical protein